MSSSIQDHDEEIFNLRAENAELKLNLQMAGMNSDTSTLEAELKTSRANAANNQRRYLDARHKVGVLEENAGRYVARIAELEAQAGTSQTSEEEKENLIHQHQASTKKICQLEGRLDEAKDRVSKAKSEADDLQQKVECLQRENEQLKKNSYELDKQISWVELELANAHSKSTDFETEVKKLRKQVKKLESEKAEDEAYLIQKIQQAESDNEALEEKSRKDIEELSQTAYNEGQESKAQIEDLSAQLRVVQDERDELRENCEIFKAQAEVTIASNDTIMAQEEEIAGLHEHITELLNSATDSSIQFKARLQETERIMQYWENNCYEFQQQLEILRSMGPAHSDEDATSEATTCPKTLSDELEELDCAKDEDTDGTSESSSETASESSNGVHIGEDEVTVIVVIDPADRTNWTWAQKMRAALPKKANPTIQGTEEQAKELRRLMDNHQKEFDSSKKEVKRLQKDLANAEKQVLKLQKEREKASEASGRLFAKQKDEIAAKEAQNNMNNIMLRDYARKIRGLEQDNDRLEAAAKSAIPQSQAEHVNSVTVDGMRVRYEDLA